MFSKLLLLVGVIAAVWFGWRWLSRVQAIGREKLNRQDDGRPTARPDAAAATSAHSRPRDAEDMEKCAECGAWVAPALAGPCGRPGCPYGR